MDTNTVIGHLITFITTKADYALYISAAAALGSIVTLLALGHKELKNVEGYFEELSTGKLENNVTAPIRPVSMETGVYNPELNVE